MDDFIERSNALLAVRPDSTRVSVRYTHAKVKHQKESTVGAVAPAVVVFKTYDPVSGTVFKIRVTKANELSRILSSLGPHSVEITRTKTDDTSTIKKRGMASLMTEVAYPDAPEVPQAAKAEQQAETKTSKKKKPKKK